MAEEIEERDCESKKTAENAKRCEYFLAGLKIERVSTPESLVSYMVEK
jgi:hypothetical protein